jgi:iron complex transport system ATP-binding protein
LNAAAEVCDRVYVVCGGAVVQSGTPEDVFTESLLSEVFGLRATVLQHPRTGKPLIAFDYLGEEP